MIKPLSVDDSTTSRPRLDPPALANTRSERRTVPKYRRQELASEAARRNREQLVRLGGRLRDARRRRRLTQAQLGDRVGVSRSAVSAMERGLGGGHTIDTWQRLAVALDIRLAVDLGRDPIEEPADAGHLKVQELV